MSPKLSILAMGIATMSSSALAQNPHANQFVEAGNTLVSAMMMFVGNSEKVYILDKAEANAERVNGHPAWGSVWDMNTHEAEVMDVRTNVFCASGIHLPNGSYVTFGGNNAVSRGGGSPSQADWDGDYNVFDGGNAIRLINPCASGSDFATPNTECTWFDDPSVLSMQRRRWYSTAEPTGTGEIVLIGGFRFGGYINRNYPNDSPCGDAAECTAEFFPANGRQPIEMDFMRKTSGLNAYAHAFQMPSGKMFVQANYSSILWDVNGNVEQELPDMPNQVIRVYPASGGVAMLPLTPANNYEATVLFCGGSDMSEYAWGNYSFPFINTWDYPASKDCQRITPEPLDGSAPQYVKDDDMIDGRSMGQFIILPNGKLLMINGGLNGTAGYADATGETPNKSGMVWGQSLASGPLFTPAIYDPTAPAGSRWSNADLGASPIPRLYHSSAVLLPDASVLVAGSNPNVDVDLETIFKTEYRAEVFYPPYFTAKTRPVPQGVPKTLSYGGNYFDITIPPSSYSGSGNDAAASATVSIIRSGFTTHAMNMGQRYMQLENTYTVKDDGTIVLHVSQVHPNPNLFQPGPAFLHVNIHDIPSNGTYVIVGNGIIGEQPVAAAQSLPPSVKSQATTSTGTSTGDGATEDTKGSGNSDNGAENSRVKLYSIIGGIVGAVGLLGAIYFFFFRRRHSPAPKLATTEASTYPMTSRGDAYPFGSAMSGQVPTNGFSSSGPGGIRNSDTSAFVPIQQDNYSQAWNASTSSLMNGQHPQNIPYRDDLPEGRASAAGMSVDYDPYSRQPMNPQYEYGNPAQPQGSYGHVPGNGYSGSGQYNR